MNASSSSSSDSFESSAAAVTNPNNHGGILDMMNWRGLMQQLSEHSSSSAVPPRVWKVCDAALPLAPSILAPKTIVFANPSVPASTIAIRIAECCHRRSIAVEYDDEGAVAHAVTMDRCVFDICLYKGKTGTATAKPSEQCLMVEIALISGNPISFHRARIAISKAALALDSGKDQRQYYQTNRQYYQTNKTERLLQKPKSILARSKHRSTVAVPTAATPAAAAPPSSVVTADANDVVTHLEQAYQCLIKDRWDAQVLGMESIITATDEWAVGEAFAKMAAQFLLLQDQQQHKSNVLKQLSVEIFRILIQRRYPGENSEPTTSSTNYPNNNTITKGKDGASNSNNNNTSTHSSANWQILDDEHTGNLRSLALRIVLQAIRIINGGNEQNHSSWTMMMDPMWYSKPMLEALVQDVVGGIVRPGHVPSRRAGPHEAHLALQILAALAQAPMMKQDWIVPELSRAIEMAKTTQPFLVEAAKNTYAIYTQEEREC